jgi:rod shape determining protein RodA
VFPFIWLVMLFAAGASLKQLGWILFAGASSLALVLRSGFLEEHQLNRIAVFFDPELDPQGIGFQLLQSKRAIGAGQLVGRGLFQGTQTNLAYIPEQENDFIFTAIAEQLGFIGGVLVLAAFLVIVWRLLAISANSRDRFGALVAVGFAAMIGFHVFVNVGMTVGLTPVTGLPLPFISQGGSFYIAMGMVIGIANSIWLRRSVVPGEMYPG